MQLLVEIIDKQDDEEGYQYLIEIFLNSQQSIPFQELNSRFSLIYPHRFTQQIPGYFEMMILTKSRKREFQKQMLGRISRIDVEIEKEDQLWNFIENSPAIMSADNLSKALYLRYVKISLEDEKQENYWLKREISFNNNDWTDLN